MMTFGEIVRNRRIEIGIGLRRFCEMAGVDASNWSKIERGKLQVTTNRTTLERIAQILKFEQGSEQWHFFFDQAAVASRRIPDYVYSDQEMVDALPVFFRTSRGEKPTDEQLQKLIDILKNR